MRGDGDPEGHTVQHRITFRAGRASRSLLLEDQILQGKITVIPEEGVLPETCNYSRGTTTREQILGRYEEKAMERRVADAWAQPDTAFASPRNPRLDRRRRPKTDEQVAVIGRGQHRRRRRRGDARRRLRCRRPWSGTVGVDVIDVAGGGTGVATLYGW